jgi:hypothetical protein
MCESTRAVACELHSACAPVFGLALARTSAAPVITSTLGAPLGAPLGARASVSRHVGVAAFRRPCSEGPGGSVAKCAAANASSSRKEPPHCDW